MDRPIAGTEGQSFDGGRHCGAIRFRAGGPLREVFLCHCSDCLKLSGTSWGASAAYEDHFHYLTEARPRWYRSSQGAERGFCADCGAQMFYRRDGRDMISIAPGAFDEGEMLYVGGQIFHHSNPAWGPVAPADILDLDTPDHANRGQ